MKFPLTLCNTIIANRCSSSINSHVGIIILRVVVFVVVLMVVVADPDVVHVFVLLTLLALTRSTSRSSK